MVDEERLSMAKEQEAECKKLKKHLNVLRETAVSTVDYYDFEDYSLCGLTKNDS
jgi:hypothetical protein